MEDMGHGRKQHRGLPLRIEHLEPRLLMVNLPEGFVQSLVAEGMQSVTSLTIAPDDRIFVSEQAGAIRIIENGQLLETPFATLPAVAEVELGLKGIAFDPDFESNHYLYAYYTGLDWRNRVVRLTADGNSAVPGSEVVLWTGSHTFVSPYHAGGAIRFLPDGTLIFAQGENFHYIFAQNLDSQLGKIMRINADGSIPEDNPFYNQTTGDNRAIWARGLRNPFSIAIQPGTDRIFINDVGENSWEEINEAVAGANYGWSITEGDFDPQLFPDFTQPIHSYAHPPQRAAVTGGDFYNPQFNTFGEYYTGDYFFCDFVSGWIRRLDLSGPTPQSIAFADGLTTPMYLTTAADGSLYYLEQTTGSLWQIQNTAINLPQISNHPQDRTVSLQESAAFTVIAGGPSLGYQWQRDGIDIEGATEPTYTLASAELLDDGAVFQCVVTNPHGSITSDPATLTVLNNQLPEPTILTPLPDANYVAGAIILYSGEGFDPEDGVLAAPSFSWRIDFHHHTHVHPVMLETPGMMTGSLSIPALSETDSDVFYRIYLTVTDSAGAQRTVFRDVTPITVNVTIATEPAGVPFLLDGQPRSGPYSFNGVVGILRSLDAPILTTVGGQQYQFLGWSNGGAASHTFATPPVDTTITAFYLDMTAPAVVETTFGWNDPQAPHAIRFRFSEDVSQGLDPSSVFVKNMATGQIVQPFNFLYESQTNAATFLLPATLADGNYQAWIASVSDQTGNTMAASTPFDFFVLGGDANRDRMVDVRDLVMLSSNWYGTSKTFSEADFNYDGVVNQLDLTILAQKWQARVEPPPPPPTAPMATAAGRRSPTRTPVRAIALVL